MDQRHMIQYYSILLKCLACTNGKALEQYEAVKPGVILIKYGPAAAPTITDTAYDRIHSPQR